MVHLFKHSKTGFYDIAFVVKGRYICGSNQGYENRNDAFKAILSVANIFKAHSFIFQDDVPSKSIVYYAVKNLPKKNFIVSATSTKPSKKYIPNSK